MKTFDVFGDLSLEEVLGLLNELVENNPAGVIFVNESMEVLYYNSKINELFDGDTKSEHLNFGNVFKCEYVVQTDIQCGKEHQCRNCKIRNLALNSLKLNRPIKNTQINRTFFIKGKKVIKWLDLSVSPITIKGKQYLWLAVIDLTELVQYKIEAEMAHLLSEQHR